jgi:hypothetical protein
VCGLTRSADLIADGGTLYFAEPDAGKIRSVSISGAGLSELATGEGKPRALAVDATHLYWLAGQEVRRVSRAGGTVTTLAPTNLPSDLAIDATHVYWLDAGTLSLRRVAKGGGPSEELWRETNEDPGLGRVGALAVDDEFVFFENQQGHFDDDRQINRLRKSDRQLRAIHVSSYDSVPEMTLSAGRLYFAYVRPLEDGGYDFYIQSVDRELGDLRTNIFIKSSLETEGFWASSIELMVDAGTIYWGTSKMSHCGDDVVHLTSLTGVRRSVVVDGYLYFPQGNCLNRIAK